MKKFILLLLTICVGCQTTKISNEKYKVSTSTTELGSIGVAETKLNFENSFNTRSFPKLDGMVRLEIKTFPFNKQINDIYLEKTKVKQQEATINYVDSLPNKPEYVTVSILDVNSYIKELNADYNKENLTFLKNTNEGRIVNNLALILSDEIISKIKSADAYYLINNQEKKYTVALYKNGKQFDSIDLHEGTALAYSLGKFCWTENDRHKWEIGDIIGENDNCLGTTSERVKKKEKVNLYKL
ncbi:hypothetical protein [Flavobacterium sp.]|uniref:hypothetical protein n=1 Tax=Flavobacterium sp. TaxID=239 RepID=UPI003A90A6E7